MEFDRTIVAFFTLFLVVYFLESIGGFYMTSAIVSIEKQFQIPSKISGLMVSAGDFGYIPSVVFVSYLGGKGNRARWIGGGCVLIAIANLLISSSNFLFPVETVSLNSSVLQTSIERDTRRLDPNSPNFANFLLHVPPKIREKIQSRFSTSPAEVPSLTALAQNFESEWLGHFDYCNQIEVSNMTADDVCQAFFDFLRVYNSATNMDVENLRLMSGTSYAYCDMSLNNLRSMIRSIRCRGNVSYVGPTATIFLGLLFLGVGRTMPFSLGLPLVDDNVKKSNLPIYFAAMFFIRIMGPVIGFMMGSFFNKFYYTADAPKDISPRDPMWIGMWWGGFLVIGSLLFGPSLGLFCFRAPAEDDEEEVEKSANLVGATSNAPMLVAEKTLNGSTPADSKNGGLTEPPPQAKRKTKLALVDRYAERDENGDALMPSTVMEKVHDFVSTISTVVRQPIYVGTLAGRIVDVFAFKGFYIFLPKYLEIQFGIPQYKINMYMGVIGVVGFALGVLIGSVVMRVFKLEGRRVAAWVAICSALAACLSFMNANVGCRSTLTALGDNVASNFNINASCVAGCGCEHAPLYPVCDEHGRVYYSPCHAGCRHVEVAANLSLTTIVEKSNVSPSFGRCACASGGRVSRDMCLDPECDWKVKLYFANMAIGGIIGGMGVVPGILIMLRSVPPRHRSVSLGFNGFLVSLLATLPSPITWGAIIDHFCIYWEKKCDGRGACSLYATDRLRVWLHCVYGTLRIIALASDVYVIYHAKNLKMGGVDDEAAAPDELKKKKAGEEGVTVGEKSLPEKEGALHDLASTKNADDVVSLPDVSLKPPPPLRKMTPTKRFHNGGHSRSASRDFYGNGADEDAITSEDLRKSSTYIAGPISEI